MEMDVNKVLGTSECEWITVLFIAQRSCTHLHPQPLDFLTGEIGVLQRLEQGIMRP